MADDLITVVEETHHWIDFDFESEAGVDLTTSNVATMFMTIYLEGTVTDLLARTDVRNAGAWDQGVTIPTAGTLTIKLTPAWNAIVGSNPGRFEKHTILIEGTTAGTPSHTFARVFSYQVANLDRVT